ncbi:hypothetical protein EVA_11829 [gut metagenome]|uniref:Uncharacterized protein n=1 Tax=gut metagenome TaxID=749906 RepID=J9CJ50_9ZZZZ
MLQAIFRRRAFKRKAQSKQTADMRKEERKPKYFTRKNRSLFTIRSIGK